MKKMRSIMVDMDEVITDGNFLRIVEKFMGKKFGDTHDSYFLQELLGDRKDEFFKDFKNVNIYEDAELLPDCYDVLKRLSKYYKIYICTDYIWPEVVADCGNFLKYKYEYLYKALDFLDPRCYIFTGDKSVINCDVRIDDKLKNIEGADVKLLYTAYHNTLITDEELDEIGVVRVNGWKDIERVLLKASFDETYGVLVNKKHVLLDDYEPRDLVEVDEEYDDFIVPGHKIMLRKDAYENFLEMKKDAKRYGIDLHMESGYRSYEYQQAVLNHFVMELGREEALKICMKPGFSEHQTGLAIDIIYKKYGVFVEESDEEDEEIKWLMENAYKYGYVLRYPKGKEKITGVDYEIWHYRFVGLELASKLKENNWTLEEYHANNLLN